METGCHCQIFTISTEAGFYGRHGVKNKKRPDSAPAGLAPEVVVLPTHIRYYSNAKIVNFIISSNFVVISYAQNIKSLHKSFDAPLPMIWTMQQMRSRHLVAVVPTSPHKSHCSCTGVCVCLEYRYVKMLEYLDNPILTSSLSEPHKAPPRCTIHADNPPRTLR